MTSLTEDECKDWSSRNSFGDCPPFSCLLFEPHEIMMPMKPLWHRTAWFSRFLASSLDPFDECLLWVTQTGVWPSSENLPLMERLRSSYGDVPSLDMALGNIFKQTEQSDLVSFFQVSLLCVWDFHLLSASSKVRIAVSHDEFVHLFIRDEGTFKQLKDDLAATNVSFDVKK